MVVTAWLPGRRDAPKRREGRGGFARPNKWRIDLETGQIAVCNILNWNADVRRAACGAGGERDLPRAAA